jgi:DNA invertase Pin-like site-specific DNA recombinase
VGGNRLYTYTMRIALYARVSTRDKGQDTENQRQQLREFAKRNGWAVVHEYVDRMSGKTAKRPQFQEMMQAARQREFDMLLFWSLDRLSREGVLATLQHLQALTDAGVHWRSYTEQYLDSCGAFRDAVMAILATIAKQEHIRIVERVHAGLARAKRQGVVLGRPRVICDRAKIQRMRDGGLSFRQIASRLDLSVSTVVRAAQEVAA